MGNRAEIVSVIDTSSIDKALNNYLILRTIMQHLATKELFNVRLVAKKWEEEATIQLLSTRSSHQAKFEWNRKELKFRNKVGTLEEFTDSCYSNPLRKFPCSKFHFEDITEWDLEAPADLVNFFSNHGHQIKNLSLHARLYTDLSINTLRKIIFEWTPNLKSLTLDGDFDIDQFEYSPTTQQIEDVSKTISNLSLEHLEISRDVGDDATQHWSLLITDILLSAPNLKTISDDHFWFTKEIASSGKIGAVRRFPWDNYESEHMMVQIVEFSGVHPQLTFLEVDLLNLCQTIISSNFLPSLLRILQSSRDTLKTFKFVGRLDLLDWTSDMEFPILKNLQEFVVLGWAESGEGQGKILPGGLSVQRYFPRLKMLTLDDIGDPEPTTDEDNPLIHDCNSSTTVQELTIVGPSAYEHYFPPDFQRQALDLYPNVRVFNLKLEDQEWNEIPGIFSGIWKYCNESLIEDLGINLPILSSDDYAEIVDQGLTGFDQETCRMLKKQRCCRHCHGGETLERGPSILDMTKLKLFQLTRNPDLYSSDTFPMFSQVAVTHAFDLMIKRQNLTVRIDGVKLNKVQT